MDKNWLKNWQKPVSAKVAETLVEMCFCQHRFKAVLAETCQHCVNYRLIIIIIIIIICQRTTHVVLLLSGEAGER